MITTPLAYLFTLALIATSFYLLESKVKWRLLRYTPAVVLVYAFSMFLASMGAFEYNDAINATYKTVKSNLLPAMLFLMLLQVDLKHFVKLGQKLLIAYLLALFSIAFAFIAVASLFHFSEDMAGAFGALAGSWMGGTANMIAVGTALDVSEDSFAYALIVDSVNYTLWVVFLLFLVPFAQLFNRFTKAKLNALELGDVGCACSLGAKRYWQLIAISLFVSFLSQYIGTRFIILNETTTVVITATLFGIAGSFTSLRYLNGANEVATSMLYIIIALIGSKAVIESFDAVGSYVLAGFFILLLHALLMLIGAKIFRLDLFSISVASLANIGGVASAPILAAMYSKHLVGVGILMAIMGYIIGTFGGLAVGNVLLLLNR